jgi:SAM-dependent methyltransferase
MPLSERYSDGTYSAANPDWGRERAPWKARQVHQLLRNAGVVPSSILDVGCGTGVVLQELGALITPRPTLIGLEPAGDVPFAEDVTRHVRVERVTLDEFEGGAEVGLLLDVFEHVERPFDLLRDVASRCRWVVCHIPLEISVVEVAAGLLGRSRDTVGHINYYSMGTALGTLDEAGLEVVSVLYTGSAFDGPGRKRWTLLNVLRRAGFRFSPALVARWLGGVSVATLAQARPSSQQP